MNHPIDTQQPDDQDPGHSRDEVAPQSGELAEGLTLNDLSLQLFGDKIKEAQATLKASDRAPDPSSIEGLSEVHFDHQEVERSFFGGFGYFIKFLQSEHSNPEGETTIFSVYLGMSDEGFDGIDSEIMKVLAKSDLDEDDIQKDNFSVYFGAFEGNPVALAGALLQRIKKEFNSEDGIEVSGTQLLRAYLDRRFPVIELSDEDTAGLLQAIAESPIHEDYVNGQFEDPFT